MKIVFVRFSIILIIVTLFASCDTSPDLPSTPSIEFVKVEYWDMGLQSFDSLNITIGFEDGDGDLGLTSNDIFPPYNSTYFYLDNDDSLITLAHREKGVPFDTLPPFTDPYYCTNYAVNPRVADQAVIFSNGDIGIFNPVLRDSVLQDTVYFQSNPDHFNIFVDFMIEQSNGEFERFPWESWLGLPDCGGGFNARFTPRDLGINENGEEAIKGLLTYRMISLAFPFVLRNERFKLRISIQDRALNRSNVVESPVLTLEDIRQN